MKDTVMQEGKWTFDEEITRVFDNMLERSIPNKVGSRYVQPNTSIIDIGCSNVLSVQPFVMRFNGENDYRLC